MPDALTVADTGAPACIALADERLVAAQRDQARGLLVGGRRMVQHGLAGLESGLFLLEQAADQGAPAADIAASAAELERDAARLLARLVKLLAENTATPDQRAA